MGRVLLVGRLAVRDLWRRPAEAALLVLAIMAATTTLDARVRPAGMTSTPTRAHAKRQPGPTSWPVPPGTHSSASPPTVPPSRR